MADVVLESVSEILNGIGYQTVTACSGEEAVHLYQSRRAEIDLVLLDIVMPGLNGAETLQKLRLINPFVNVVMSSGYSDQEVMSQVKWQMPTDFLPKPYSVEQITRTIANSLGGPRMVGAMAA